MTLFVLTDSSTSVGLLLVNVVSDISDWDCSSTVNWGGGAVSKIPCSSDSSRSSNVITKMN